MRFRPRKVADQRRAKGKRAENAAIKALKAKGYRILQRNYRHALGEIDIVAEEGETLAFVEVRSKRQGGPVRPIESVDFTKRQRLVALAQLYLAKEKTVDRPCRFDVAEVILNEKDKVCSVELLRDAFGG